MGKRRNIFLAEEIIELILLRVPPRSVLRFRCVCKSWLLLTSRRYFIRAHSDRQRRAAPGVLLQSSDPTFFDLHLRRIGGLTPAYPTSVMGIGHHGPIKVEGSCDGMLCLSAFHKPDVGYSGYSYYLFNPLTQVWTILPSWDWCFRAPLRETIEFCGFYFHQSNGSNGLNGEYKLLRYFRNVRNTGYELYTIGAGKEGNWKWVRVCLGNSKILHAYGPTDPLNDAALDVDDPLYPLFQHTMFRPLLSSPPVVINGSLHWAQRCNGSCRHDTGGMFLLAFDCQTHGFRNITLPTEGGSIWWHNTTLIEMEMSLGLCRKASAMEMDIWFLEDYAKEKWVKRYNLNFEELKRESLIPLAVVKDKTLVLSCKGYLIIHNIERKTCKSVELNNTNEEKNGTMLFLHRESLGWYDTFEKGS